VPTAFIEALVLDEDRLYDLGSTIGEAGEPHEEARRSAQENREVFRQPWVARDTQ
jgi:hypothetical protein